MARPRKWEPSEVLALMQREGLSAVEAAESIGCNPTYIYRLVAKANGTWVEKAPRRAPKRAPVDPALKARDVVVKPPVARCSVCWLMEPHVCLPRSAAG